MRPLIASIALALCALPVCAAAAEEPNPYNYPEAKPYDAQADASAEVDAALARAAGNGKGVLIVMGANWCHDSRLVAGLFQTPRFKALIDERYELVYVDAGMPQSGKGRNLDIAARLGFGKVEGTPTVLILSSTGQLLNKNTATNWRNASLIPEDEIYGELANPQKAEKQ